LSRSAPGRDGLERQVAARRQARASRGSSSRLRFYAPLAALTSLMSLDLRLFGHLRAGPYFVLVEKT
jgi:hypothetical protein